RSTAETRAIGRMDFIAFDYASGPNCSHATTRFDKFSIQRGLEQDRAIGQLVRVRAAAREMLLEQSAHATDAGDRALSEAADAIVRLDLAAHLLPRRLRNALGDAAVREDLDVAVGEEHVDEHAVVRRRIPYAEMAEHFERARARGHLAPQLVDVERGLDDEADFARVPAFHFGDRRLDFTQHRRGEELTRAPASGEEMTQGAADTHELTPPTSCPR